MSIDTSRRAAIRGYFGASGTGKSTAAKAWLRQRAPDRLLIFDPEGEYDRWGILCPTGAELLRRLKAGMAGEGFRLRYAPPIAGRPAAFNVFCRIALAVAERCGGCVVVVDELAEVTTPGKAVAGWGGLVRTGRKRGVELVACSIRPAEIDKTFWSQCTYVRSGRLSFGPDLARMAGMLDCTPDQIAGLRDLEYIERDIQGQTPADSGIIRPAGRSKKASNPVKSVIL
jgi:hypothetical protein